MRCRHLNRSCLGEMAMGPGWWLALPALEPGQPAHREGVVQEPEAGSVAGSYRRRLGLKIGFRDPLLS